MSARFTPFPSGRLHKPSVGPDAGSTHATLKVPSAAVEYFTCHEVPNARTVPTSAEATSGGRFDPSIWPSAPYATTSPLVLSLGSDPNQYASYANGKPGGRSINRASIGVHPRAKWNTTRSAASVTTPTCSPCTAFGSGTLKSVNVDPA